MKKKIILPVILGLFLLLLIGEWIGFTWSQDVLFTSCQPQDISYNSFYPYCLGIIKMKQPLSRRTIILISKKAEPDYGHVLNFPTADIVGKEEFDQLKVSWTAVGIDIETIWNVKLFIPKKNFIGGR